MGIQVFFSYSHKDEDLRNELDTHLSTLKRQGLIEAWHDRQIQAGAEWASEIEGNLNVADVILLLVSANFIASDFCWGQELARALERHDNHDDPVRVIPIILKPVEGWTETPFARLQVLPTDGQPITQWGDRDSAYVDVARGIRQVVEAVSEFKANFETNTRVTPAYEPREKSVDGIEDDLELDDLTGSVPLDSRFYIERPPTEHDCYRTILKPAALIRIKAPRQMGKSSLLQRILYCAREKGYQTVCVSFQTLDDSSLSSLDTFLQWFCSCVSDRLGVEDRVETLWQGVRGSINKCSNYFGRYLLRELESPLTVGIDEVDEVFQYPLLAADFFGMLRSWYEEGRNDETWQKLRLVLTHSKEVYVPMNINQSPFNVGLPIELPELNQEQVQELVGRYQQTWDGEKTSQLMDLVGGHPHLLRVALNDIVRGRITLEDLQEVAATESSIYGDHLSRHLGNVQKDPSLRAAMQQVVRADGPIQLEQEAKFKLRSMGLVKLVGNRVVPTCNLYRRYFCDCLTDS